MIRFLTFTAIVLRRGLENQIRTLLLMTIAAAVTASRRLKGIGRPVLLSFWAIFAGSAVVIVTMLTTGALRTDIVILVPGQHDHRKCD